MCDNRICSMSERWEVAGRLSGQFARQPLAVLKIVQCAKALEQRLTLQVNVETALCHTAACLAILVMSSVFFIHRSTRSLSHAFTHAVACAGARISFEYPQSFLPVRPSAHRTFLGMSDDVSVDKVGILCYSAGPPCQEILWLRHQLSSRTISRQLFTELDRQLIFAAQSQNNSCE